MLLLIDNYDSFTYNLSRYFCELGEQVKVVRNDEISCAQIARMAPEKLVISPGPCTPNEAGISLAAIERFADSIPILGVCLGHQSIGQVFGAKVVKAKEVMHGKVSSIHHDQSSLFAKVSNPFDATRYHSLVLDQGSLPSCFKVHAVSNNDEHEIMAISHQQLPLFGVQFHPESLLTSQGHQILQNFINLSNTFAKG